MKTILVPCDFSPQSRAAYQTALEMASKAGGKVILLHVLYIPTLYTSSLGGEAVTFDPVYFTTMEDDARNELEKMKGEAKSLAVEVTSEVVFGEIITSIKRITEANKVDIIIMGTTGASGLSEMFIGSNTEKVVRHASVPVIALRSPLKISSIRNILLPSTLNLDQVDFIRKVQELQEFFNATLHILLINTPTNFRRDAEAGEALEEFTRHYKLTNYQTHFRNYWHEEDGIADFAQNEKMDLIAMGTHALKGLSHLFLGSTTEDVVNHIQIPVWTYALKSK